MSPALGPPRESPSLTASCKDHQCHDIPTMWGLGRDANSSLSSLPSYTRSPAGELAGDPLSALYTNARGQNRWPRQQLLSPV